MAKGTSSGGVAPWMGQSKDPPKQNPVKAGGRAPNVHSHSAKLKTKISPKRGGGKRIV